MRRTVDADERAPLEAAYDGQEYEDTVTFERAERESAVDPETVILSGELMMLHLSPIIRPVVRKKTAEITESEIDQCAFHTIEHRYSIPCIYPRYVRST